MRPDPMALPLATSSTPDASARRHDDVQVLLDAADAWFSTLSSAVVALSGGVDSSLVAVLAQRACPKVLCVTGVSASLSTAEQADIQQFVDRFGLRHVEQQTHEFDAPDYVKNDPDRCFHCKDELYGRLSHVARAQDCDVVLDGTHAGDLGGHRPGLRAAERHDVRSPFVELGWGKDIIRRLAAHLDLPNQARPSQPCLSSRLAYGLEVTADRLGQVASAEAALKAMGFAKCRVRHHDAIARIEVPKASLPDVLQRADDVVQAVKDAGFVYVTLDLQGLRSGSLLEVLPS